MDISTENVEFWVLSLVEHVVLTIFHAVWTNIYTLVYLTKSTRARIVSINSKYVRIILRKVYK